MKLLALGLLVAFGCGAIAAGAPAAKSVYDFKMTDIDGKKVPLKKYQGKVLLIVNTASKCGFTPQYAGLEKLYKEYKDKGVVVLGFPANNFREQEPGTNAEIKEFCTANYGVSFPMFSKISVKGDDQAALYQWLIANSDRPNDPIEWNFAKFVIGKDGKVSKRLTPKDTPDGAELRSALDAALAK